jgi:DNA polymerase-3 subunit delta
MKFEQILTDLRNKIYKPVYFLHGEEEYFIDIITDYIAENILDEADREFNQTILYGKDVDVGSIIDTARRYPMMSKYQVVIVKELINAPTKKKKKATRKSPTKRGVAKYKQAAK